MRPIDADRALEIVRNQGIAHPNAYHLTNYATLILIEAPTIEVKPVNHGRFEWFEEWSPSTPDHPAECQDCGWRCSECKTALEDIVGGYWDDIDREPMINYCPNCGAKMDDE